MSRSRAVFAALLLATGVGCAGSTGGQSGTAGAGNAAGGNTGSGGAMGSARRRRRDRNRGQRRRQRSRRRDRGHRRRRDRPRRPVRSGRQRRRWRGRRKRRHRWWARRQRRKRRARRKQRRRGSRRRVRRGGAAAGGSGGSAGTNGTGGITVPAGYKLVWSDEFDVDGRPSSANWKYEQGFVRNEEAQWYQPDNATVSGGVLIIEARREQKANPNYMAGSTDWKRNRQYAEYTSTSMITSGLHSWQFGRFEMRGRIDTRSGMWPAWWTLGNSGEWPSNGEIDIMEFYRGNVLANVACGTSTRYQAKWDSVSKPISSFNDAQWSSKFHVWRMDWDDTKIDLYLDDVLMNTSNLADMLNPNGKSPFRQPDYMILNLAIGGQNGGDPANTTFPARFEVDYVRVFQKM